MLSVSLFVELLHTRPLILFWAMVALQSVLWTSVPMLFYSAPPGQLPMLLAIGHEFQFGTEFGPPLAFWLAELAFRSLGMAGVYLLSQLCIVVTYGAVMALGRAIVGPSHAVMAVLLMAGIAVFSLPATEFGPAVLATPLWALVLLYYWKTMHSGHWSNWIALGLAVGLLLLTTYAGLILLGLIVFYALASRLNRNALLDTVGPWIAGVVAVIVLFPYLIWLDQSGRVQLSDLATIIGNLRAYGWLVALLLAAHAGLAVLIVLARGAHIYSRAPAPVIPRPQIQAGVRSYVYFFAFAPAVAMTLFALFAARPDNFVGTPLVVMSGLAVVTTAGERIKLVHQYLIGYVWAVLLAAPPFLVALAIVFQPWTLAVDLRVGRPAQEIARFFSDNFQRRTGRPLAIVAGDPALAELVSLQAPSRPRLYLESAPEFLPRITKVQLAEEGAVVIWRATDTAGRPPPNIVRQFSGLVPEVPQRFTRRFQGRMEPIRLGWGMIRPIARSNTPQP